MSTEAVQPAPQDITAEGMRKLFGRAILFVGVEAQHWTIGTFTGAAKLARSLGFDTLCPKRCDGSIKWYGDAANLRAEREAVLAQGMGYVPFLYAYGPKFGVSQVHDECACLVEMAEANEGSVVCDMEAEWDGQVNAAHLFCDIMRPVQGVVLGVTTWADPVQQDWEGVAQALAPCVNLWIPQQYDNWLAAQAIPPEETIVQPGIDLTTEFGLNNVLAIAHQTAARHESAWVWEYAYASQAQNTARTITSILHEEALAELPGLVLATPDQLATPDMGYSHAYVINDMDSSLADIGSHLGLSNWYEELYKPNKETLEAAARAAGHPGSSGGLVLIPGTKLNYNL